MNRSITMDTPVTLRQAFLVMHAYLCRHWESTGKPDEIGSLLSELSLWETERGAMEHMDGAVFPTWLHCAEQVISDEAMPEGHRGADIVLDGTAPDIKVVR